MGSLARAGGGVHQECVAPLATPDAVKCHQKSATAKEYRDVAVSNGIAFRAQGLFPPNDPLLNELASTPGLFPFEKHLAGENSSCQPLPKGGWVTGDAAAGKVDLRMFYKDPAPGEQFGTLKGALRYGDGACIGNGFWTTVHGGAIESALDEATAELAKVCWTPCMTTVEISFKLRKPVPQHTSLLVECRVKEQKGIRLWVEGSIKTADGSLVLATCEAMLADISQFI